MKTAIRNLALKLKKDSEQWDSPVPKRIRMDLHALGKWLYCMSYDLTPERVREIMSGADADAVDIINANRCLMHYGSTLHDSGLSHHVHFGEPALLARLAYQMADNSLIRMARYNNIDLARYWDGEGLAERCNMPKGTRFYYVEPIEEDDEEDSE